MIVKPTWEHEPAREHLGCLAPRQDGFSRIFRQFELNRSLCLALDHRHTFANVIILHEIRHREFDEITSTQLAVYSDVEQGQVVKATREF